MNLINPEAAWSNIPQLETSTPASGGADGTMNAQAVALTARLKYLHDIYIPDMMRKQVEAESNGMNTVIYDQFGNPNLMVVIPQFIEPLTNSIHRAFYISGHLKSEIFIAKFQASIISGLARSLANQVPATSMDYATAIGYCRALGPGWHVVTNAEWMAAVSMVASGQAMLRAGNLDRFPTAAINEKDFVIGGNLWRGQGLPMFDGSWCAEYANVFASGKRIDGQAPGADGVGLCYTGSGGNAWNHDGSPFGIADMIGNIAEYVAGLRINGGRLNFIDDNDAADDAADLTMSSALWRIMLDTGEITTLDVVHGLGYKNSTGGTPHPVLTNEGTFTPGNSIGYFGEIESVSGLTPPPLLKVLGVSPENMIAYDWIARRFGFRLGAIGVTSGTKIAVRGGSARDIPAPIANWTTQNAYQEVADLASVDIRVDPATGGSNIGFRLAYHS